MDESKELFVVYASCLFNSRNCLCPGAFYRRRAPGLPGYPPGKCGDCRRYCDIYEIGRAARAQIQCHMEFFWRCGHYFRNISRRFLKCAQHGVYQWNLGNYIFTSCYSIGAGESVDCVGLGEENDEWIDPERNGENSGTAPISARRILSSWIWNRNPLGIPSGCSRREHPHIGDVARSKFRGGVLCDSENPMAVWLHGLRWKILCDWMHYDYHLLGVRRHR